MVLLLVLVLDSRKVKEEKTFIETGNTDFIWKNDLDKACFQHNMAYGKSINYQLSNQTINSQMNFIGKLLENLGDEKLIRLWEKIFGA